VETLSEHAGMGLGKVSPPRVKSAEKMKSSKKGFCMYTSSREGVKKMESDSSWWCAVNGQEAVGTN